MSVAKETKKWISAKWNVAVAEWQEKRFQNYCAEIPKANSVFCSWVNKQDSGIFLEEMQSVFQENAFLLFKCIFAVEETG